MSFEKLIIVYGTLKKGYHNNRLLQNNNSEYLGKIETLPNYTLFDGGFPIVERDGKTSIKGELWKITDPYVMHNIHSLEGCTGIAGHPDNWYDLEENIYTPFGNASMYVMNSGKSERNKILKTGLWE